MTTRILRTVQHGLVIAVAAALAACSAAGAGDLARAVPAWSPPTWMHGTWKASGPGGQSTIEASRYTLIVKASIGASSFTIDLADGAERGLYTIRHDAGTWHVTGDLYYELVLTGGSAAPVYLWFTRMGSNQLGLWQTDPIDPSLVIGDPVIFTKQ